jgi:cell division ATPase FtsA
MKTTMVLDLGASSTKLTIVDYGIVRVSHVINKGAQDITFALSKSTGVSFGRAEEIKRESGILGDTGDKNISSVASPVIEYIFFEANKVLSNYQKKYQRSVSKVLLVGGGSLLHGLSEVASRNFEVEVVYGNPFAKVEAPAFLDDILRGVGLEFSVAVGLALRELQNIS